MLDMVIFDDLCQLGAKCFFVEILFMICKTVVVEMSLPDHLAGIYGSLFVRRNRPEYQNASMDHPGVLTLNRKIFSQAMIQHVNMGIQSDHFGETCSVDREGVHIITFPVFIGVFCRIGFVLGDHDHRQPS